MPQTITTDTLNLVQKGTQEVIKTTPPDFVDEGSPLFSPMGNEGQQIVQVKTVTGFGAGEKTPENDNVVYDTRKQVYTQNITVPKWTKGYKVSIEAKNFDLYGAIGENAMLARDALLETKQIQMAGIFNEGFTDNGEGPDGDELFSTTVGAGSGNPTYKSRPSADIAMDVDAVWQMLAEMRAVKDPRNFARRFRGNVKLVVPTGMESDALVVAEGQYKPGSAEYNTNVWAKRIQAHAMSYLTDTTAWFLVAENPAMHGLRELRGPGIDQMTLADPDVVGIKTVIFEFYKHFWVHSYGVYGVNP